jgi:hypothetical protein
MAVKGLVVALFAAGTLVLVPGTGSAQPAPPVVNVAVTTDRAAYTVGAAVTFTLTVTNPSDVPVTLTFSSGQLYDFAVTSPSGAAQVWRWGQGRNFIQSVLTRTIPPKDKLTFAERWNQRTQVGLQALSGVYAVTGLVASAGRPASEPVLFVIGELQGLPGPGCSTITSSFPNGTPAGLVAATFESPDALAGLWKFDRGSWLGWSPAEGAPNDLTTINSRDQLRICLSAPTRWITPF